MNLITRVWALPFFRFAVVGVGGFIVDTVVLYSMLAVGLDRYSGRAVSYLCAASFTWFGNRTITFADARATGVRDTAAEWLLFLLTNLGGGVVNYGVYAALVSSTEVVYAHPILGVAAGALSGMTVNYLASRWLVFRSRPSR